MSGCHDNRPALRFPTRARQTCTRSVAVAVMCERVCMYVCMYVYVARCVWLTTEALYLCMCIDWEND